MARTTSDKRPRRAGEEPDLAILKGDWLSCVNDRQGNYWTRQRLNYEARYCVWDNQSSDGRKWPKAKGRRIWPWPGAADSRVHLVDKYVREDVAFLMSIWNDMRILVRPNSPAKDAAWANRMTALLRWQVYEEMEETEVEAELLANMLLERGTAAVGIWWRREETLTRERIEMKQIEMAAEMARRRMAAGERGDALAFQAQLPVLIADPTLESQAVELVAGLTEGSATLTNAKIRSMLRQLREKGETTYPRTIVSMDRPVVRALAWNEDIWTPPTCTDPQRSRGIYIRELLEESDILERGREMKWDANYVDEVVEKARGVITTDADAQVNTSRNQNQWNALGVPDNSDLYEIVTAYERLTDADGIPGIYVTTFSPAMGGNDYAASELLDYAHGKYPFVPFVSERRSRLVEDARGYGEVASTLQQQIKKQWDSRIDRADVSTLPPSHHPPGEEPDAWGPGVQIPTLQPERFGYFETPRFDVGSKEVEETVRRFADEYFGRPVDEQNKVEANLIKRELARKWMLGWKMVHTQILQLDQQYMPDEFFFRVVGGEQGRGVRSTREEIQGPFNVTLKFNAQDLDPELVKEKLQLIERALAMDVNGIVDRNESILAAFELIDPAYAERLLRPAEAAAMMEIKDEQDTLAKLLLGIQVDVQGNEAFQLRKQALTTMIQNNPVAQNIIRNTPEVAQNVERRLEQLDFNIQQKVVNPEIGRRLGTAPSPQMNPAAQGPQQ
jgi:hypothetical protein